MKRETSKFDVMEELRKGDARDRQQKVADLTTNLFAPKMPERPTPDYGHKLFSPLKEMADYGKNDPLPEMFTVPLADFSRAIDSLKSAKSGKKSEHEVCEDLKAWWKAHEFYVIRNQQGIGSKKGLSDYTVIKNGKVLFVEAKATKGKQNENQIAFQAGVEREGGTYILAHSLYEFIEGWNRAWKP